MKHNGRQTPPSVSYTGHCDTRRINARLIRAACDALFAREPHRYPQSERRAAR